jgi:hypothetical protein
MSNKAAPDISQLVASLGSRGALGVPLAGVSLAPALIAAAIEAASRNHEDAEISQVGIECADDELSVQTNIKVKAKAWPPRPSIQTRASITLRGFTIQAGAVACTVARPLEFSSALADMVAGLAGKLLPLGELRTKDARVLLDPRPLLGPGADRLCVFAIRVSANAVVLEVGFSA